MQYYYYLGNFYLVVVEGNLIITEKDSIAKAPVLTFCHQIPQNYYYYLFSRAEKLCKIMVTCGKARPESTSSSGRDEEVEE